MDNNQDNLIQDAGDKFDETLTQAERDADTFLEWSDATLARAVRTMASIFKDHKGFNGVAGAASAIVLEKLMKEANAKTMKIVLDDGLFVINLKRGK